MPRKIMSKNKVAGQPMAVEGLLIQAIGIASRVVCRSSRDPRHGSMVIPAICTLEEVRPATRGAFYRFAPGLEAT